MIPAPAATATTTAPPPWVPIGKVSVYWPGLGVDRVRSWGRTGVVKLAKPGRATALVCADDVHQALVDCALNGCPRVRYAPYTPTTRKRKAPRA